MSEAGTVVSSEKEEQQQGASYTYWVRKITEDAAPLPVPQKLTPQDPQSQPNSATLGSAWNRVTNLTVALTCVFFFFLIGQLNLKVN